MKDHYLVLGLTPLATVDEIKTVYRNLSKQYHPDVNQDRLKEAQEKMKLFTAAYQVISHPDKRKEYDTQPLFRCRVPRGFNASKVNSKLLTRKEVKAAPSLWEKIMAYFVVPSNEIKRDTEKAKAFFSMGMTMSEKSGFYPDAKIEFGKAIKADPMFFEAQFNYGIMCYKLGDYEEAYKSFKKCKELVPGDSSTRFLLDMLEPG